MTSQIEEIAEVTEENDLSKTNQSTDKALFSNQALSKTDKNLKIKIGSMPKLDEMEKSNSEERNPDDIQTSRKLAKFATISSGGRHTPKISTPKGNKEGKMRKAGRLHSFGNEAELKSFTEDPLSMGVHQNGLTLKTEKSFGVGPVGGVVGGIREKKVSNFSS
jgi:hypothetical protein